MQVNTNKFGLNSLRYLASKVWNMAKSVELFKTKIRNWESEDCYWYLRKSYIPTL